MHTVIQILNLALDFALFIILAHIIMSWLLTFGVLNPRQPIVMQIFNGLQQLLAPIYDPIRRRLPQTGGLDLAPLVVIFGIYALKIILAGLL